MPERLTAHNWGTTTLGDCRAIAGSLVRPNRLVFGPAIAEYESAFAARIGVADAVSFATGRLALYSILKALGVGPGDEVIVQVPTHVVVANAIRFTGATPVFVDCTTRDYNIDLDLVPERCTSRSRVLLLQHTFGMPVDLDRAQELASQLGLEIVEDCVHALGSRFRDRPVGSFGRASFFSTEETKTISSAMGGIALTDDPALAAELRRAQLACAPPTRTYVARHLVQQAVYCMATHPAIHRLTRPLYDGARRRLRRGITPGATSREEVKGLRPDGYETRFGNGQAIIALRQLHRLDENLAHRRAITARYTAALPELGFAVPTPPPGAEPVYVRFPIRVENRVTADREVGNRVVLGRWFNSVLQLSDDPARAGYVSGSCPIAEQLAGQLMNLPTHPRVSGDDVTALLGLLRRVATVDSH